MAGSKRLIVGLGNPGPEYEGTRHNVGFQVADLVAERARGAAWRFDGRAEAFIAEGRLRGRPVMLAKPLTYMNLSGRTVRELVRRHGFDPPEVLVVYDDVALPPGKLRLREKGSAGGHNGVQDIIERLGTEAFPRLRLGIGDDFGRGRQADYVLSPFSPEQQPLIDEALPKARDAAIAFVTDGITTAMNRFN